MMSRSGCGWSAKRNSAAEAMNGNLNSKPQRGGLVRHDVGVIAIHTRVQAVR
ncbi:hypothetical protein [Novipirellula caenicola]|uniref:hypothetical protein n=1 Tax=Novipirellula caenicola TaxID=1536901 RepID=UPI0031EF583B